MSEQTTTSQTSACAIRCGSMVGAVTVAASSPAIARALPGNERSGRFSRRRGGLSGNRPYENGSISRRRRSRHLRVLSDTYRLPEEWRRPCDPLHHFGWREDSWARKRSTSISPGHRGDSGGRIGWGEHHHYFFEGTEAVPPAYDHLLIQEWMPALSCGPTPERRNYGCRYWLRQRRQRRMSAFPSTFTGLTFWPSVEAPGHSSDSASTMCRSRWPAPMVTPDRST